jgi:uncharacterized protein DUF6457
VLADWTAQLKRELGLTGDQDLDLDVRAVLDLARVAAHQVDRPAAPLTTFLVGYAAGLRGGGAEVVRELSDRAAALAEAQRHPDRG